MSMVALMVRLIFVMKDIYFDNVVPKQIMSKCIKLQPFAYIQNFEVPKGINMMLKLFLSNACSQM